MEEFGRRGEDSLESKLDVKARNYEQHTFSHVHHLLTCFLTTLVLCTCLYPAFVTKINALVENKHTLVT